MSHQKEKWKTFVGVNSLRWEEDDEERPDSICEVNAIQANESRSERRTFARGRNADEINHVKNEMSDGIKSVLRQFGDYIFNSPAGDGEQPFRELPQKKKCCRF